MAKFRYQHIKSSVEGKAPTAAQIKVAEIGVNDFAGDEKLFIKNSDGEVVDFPRGYSKKDIDDAERVIAESLNDLNTRKLDASAYTPTDLTNYYTKDETSGATEIQSALDEKADSSDIPSVSGYADSVKYNSETHYVEFYHGTTAGTKVFEYDASPFLIDGMVESVVVTSVTSGGSEVQVLEITWNSAAGSQVTDIPLSDIFDPNLYYTKSEIDEQQEVVTAALNDLEDRKLDKTDYDDDLEVITAALNDLEDRKQNVLSAGTGIDITDDVISVTGGSTDVEEELEVIAASLNDLESRKANETDLEEIGEATAYALNDLECRKQNILSAGTGIDITDDVISVTGGSTDVEEELEVIAASLNDLEDRKADKDELDDQFEVIAAALNDLEDRKLDKTDYDDDLEVIAASLNDLESRKASKTEDLDGIKLKKITQSDYDALVQAGTVDPNTLYIITD